MKRIIICSLLAGITTILCLFNIGSAPWYTIVVGLIFWDGLCGWGIYNGIKSVKKDTVKYSFKIKEEK